MNTFPKVNISEKKIYLTVDVDNVVFLTKPSKITSKLMMCLTGDPP